MSPEHVEEDIEEPEPEEIFVVRLPAGGPRAFVSSAQRRGAGRPSARSAAPR